MFRRWLMVAGLMVAGLMVAARALSTLSATDRAAWGAADSVEQSAGADEGGGAYDWLVDLFACDLKGLHKVAPSVSAVRAGSEWEEVLGVPQAELERKLGWGIAAVRGLARNGDWLVDPWLTLEVEPLVERSEDADPARVFVSVVLRLDEWVTVERAGEGEDPTAVRVMGATWDSRRLVSGPPGEVGKKVMAAADELLDAFRASYRESNPTKELSEQTGGD